MASGEVASKRQKTGAPTLKLSSGFEMPMIGLGTWKSKPGEVKAAVEAAIDAGYRHIDCAAIYGNEAEVGEGLKAKFDAGVKREDVFVVSKLWNNAHKKDDVRPACEKTLKDLGLTYLDLYLIHWPHGFQSGGPLMPKREDGSVIYDEDADYVETWVAMEELVKACLVRSIGISNFNAAQVQRVLDACTIKPAMNQVEMHPYFDQSRLKEVCEKSGISLTAYCPLGSGDNPFRTVSDPVLLQDKVLEGVGAKYKKSAAQVALRWQLQRGVVVIPKSVSPARIAENLDILDFELTTEDMQAIAGINRDWRCNVPAIMIDGKPKPRDASHKHYPFNDAF